MKAIKTVALFVSVCAAFLACVLLSSCSYHTEPEQIYPVSAMGFDADQNGIRVTVEIAVADGEKSADSKSVCFSQTGACVEEALRSMKDGLPRELIFSHCALAVFGEGLTKGQMQEIFAFAGVEDGLPLAAEVVITQNAERLLRSEYFFGAAVGYEIPQILEQERLRRGVELPCGIYRLRAVVSPDLPIALPRFELMDDGSVPSVRFVGVDILRPYAETYRLSADDCIPHAILTDTYAGAQRDGVRWRVTRNRLRLQDGGEVHLTLRVRMMGGDDREREALAAELKRSAEELFQRVTQETGEDLFLMCDRMHLQGVNWEKQITLTVFCEVV